jgi:YrhK-like protein
LAKSIGQHIDVVLGHICKLLEISRLFDLRTFFFFVDFDFDFTKKKNSPRAMKIISALLYTIGTAALMPASWLLYPEYAGTAEATISIELFIGGCALLVLAALIDLTRTLLDTEDGNYRLSVLNQMCMLMGGILFEAGSLLYWPLLSASIQNAGTWVFRFGSFSYLGGSATSLWLLALALKPAVVYDDELGHIQQSSPSGSRRSLAYRLMTARGIREWTLVVVCFIAGALLYIIGGVLSQLAAPGVATTWLVGSIFFTIGSALSLAIHSSAALAECRRRGDYDAL